MFGSRYIENMLRVVKSGSLATRNGRWLDEEGNEDVVYNIHNFWRKGLSSPTVIFNDTHYDFGGQIWAGRMQWLKEAWKHPPVTYESCEDFWISAVLKRFQNISTISPGCSTDLNFCACSHREAAIHNQGHVGNVKYLDGGVRRRNLVKLVMRSFEYRPLMMDDPGIRRRASEGHIVGRANPIEGCLWWYG